MQFVITLSIVLLVAVSLVSTVPGKKLVAQQANEQVQGTATRVQNKATKALLSLVPIGKKLPVPVPLPAPAEALKATVEERVDELKNGANEALPVAAAAGELAGEKVDEADDDPNDDESAPAAAAEAGAEAAPAAAPAAKASGAKAPAATPVAVASKPSVGATKQGQLQQKHQKVVSASKGGVLAINQVDGQKQTSSRGGVINGKAVTAGKQKQKQSQSVSVESTD